MIYAVVDEIVDKAESAAPIPEFCEIVTSVDPERDPTLRTNFRNALSRLGLTLSEEQGWAILAQVGAKHASTIVAAMAMDDLDPIIGAIEISSIFRDYLPDDDRLSLCYKNQRPPIERSRCLMPFVEFYCAPDDLYHAGLNVMAWNDRLPYAPANTLTPSEKRKAQDSLRSRYLAYAKKYLEVVLRD